MPTSFIALQCFQCSTMQVKQKKKSSNKWSCVVCNEKQSVRKLFAEASMAKDVRKFVQSFNMSRQLSDQKQSFSEELETFDSPKDEQKRKMNDWTEYVDDQEVKYCGKFDDNGDLAKGGDGLEPMVVTDIPKALFKKPKVKEYSSSGYGVETLMKPQFPNRRSAKRHQNVHSQDAGWYELEQTSGKGVSKRTDCSIRAEDNHRHEESTGLHPTARALKWNRFRAKLQDDCSNPANKERKILLEPIEGAKKSETNATREPIIRLNHTKAAKGAVSKWSSFITEEDDDDNLVDSRERTDDYQFESIMNDQRVEDDIHPDFL